jgi:hypothetical protein
MHLYALICSHIHLYARICIDIIHMHQFVPIFTIMCNYAQKWINMHKYSQISKNMHKNAQKCTKCTKCTKIQKYAQIYKNIHKYAQRSINMRYDMQWCTKHVETTLNNFQTLLNNSCIWLKILKSSNFRRYFSRTPLLSIFNDAQRSFNMLKDHQISSRCSNMLQYALFCRNLSKCIYLHTDAFFKHSSNIFQTFFKHYSTLLCNFVQRIINF